MNPRPKKACVLGAILGALFLTLTLSLPISTQAAGTNTNLIEDATLRGAIKEALGVAEADTLTTADMLRLTTLDLNTLLPEKADREKITSIEGLQHATNLRVLKLEHIRLSDTETTLGLEPLRNLTNLEILWFPNASWNVREGTYLVPKGFTSIAPLENSNLQQVNLSWSRVEDISVLSTHTNLVKVILEYTRVQDISALVTSGIKNCVIDLRRCNLNAAAYSTDLPALIEANNYVDYHKLRKVSGDDQSATVGGILPDAFQVRLELHDRRKDGTYVVTGENNQTIKWSILSDSDSVGGGSLSPTKTTTNTTGDASSTYTLGNTPGAVKVRAYIPHVQSFTRYTEMEAVFDVTAKPLLQPNVIGLSFLDRIENNTRGEEVRLHATAYHQDQAGTDTAVPGVTLEWTVEKGGGTSGGGFVIDEDGTLDPDGTVTATTDANGHAVVDYRISNTIETNRVRVRLPDYPDVDAQVYRMGIPLYVVKKEPYPKTYGLPNGSVTPNPKVQLWQSEDYGTPQTPLANHRVFWQVWPLADPKTPAGKGSVDAPGADADSQALSVQGLQRSAPRGLSVQTLSASSQPADDEKSEGIPTNAESVSEAVWHLSDSPNVVHKLRAYAVDNDFN